HDPHEEERHNGLEPECLPRADAVAGCGYAEVDRGFGERRRDQPADGARCSGGAGELCAPIGGRDRGLDTPRDEEAEGDRRIEVTAGDVAERGDHHADREPVRDRDPDQRRVADGLRGDGRAGADEDERERTDELGDGAAQDVARSLRHAAQPATAAGRIVRAHVRAHGGAVETVPRERAGERREVNARVAERLHSYGHDDFTSYVSWTCERALERGLLPHTNLGVLAREDLARLREVTASQGLMLESTSERLMETVHAGSPTKHPARRLAVIDAAGELRIPFTSGTLAGRG